MTSAKLILTKTSKQMTELRLRLARVMEDFQLRTSRKLLLQDQFDHTLIKQQIHWHPPGARCIPVSLQVHTLAFTFKYLYAD